MKMPMCCGGGRALQVNGVCFESVKQGQVTIQLSPADALYKVSWGDGTTGIYSGLATHPYSNSAARFICIEPYNNDVITNIIMDSDGLINAIPVFLFSYFTNLVQIRLRSNQLSGSIPNQIGNALTLQEILIDQNQFSGSIPPELGNLTLLRLLYLNSNQLSGSIPPELGNLTALRRLWLNDNQLSGSIPPELGNLTLLQRLYLQNNDLSGSIPSGIAAIDSMDALFLNNNSFSQADLGTFVGDLWANRATLGANACSIQLAGNNGLTATAIEQITGTGAYAGDGLVQAGCTVTY